QVQVSGAVTIAGTLTLNLLSGSISAGQSFTLIDNDGSDAVNGTFSGLPEGATVTLAPYHLRISYAGGDGNDVVPYALSATTTALSQSSAATAYGESMTLTANVSCFTGTPTGSVMFTSDGVSIGTAAVQNGVAQLVVATIEPGTHSIGANFIGTGPFA